VKVVKGKVDRNLMTPSRYGIRSISALMVFEGGRVVAAEIGIWCNSIEGNV